MDVTKMVAGVSCQNQELLKHLALSQSNRPASSVISIWAAPDPSVVVLNRGGGRKLGKQVKYRVHPDRQASDVGRRRKDHRDQGFLMGGLTAPRCRPDGISRRLHVFQKHIANLLSHCFCTTCLGAQQKFTAWPCSRHSDGRSGRRRGATGGTEPTPAPFPSIAF